MKILIELAYFNIFCPNLSFGVEKTDNKNSWTDLPNIGQKCSYDYTGLIA